MSVGRHLTVHTFYSSSPAQALIIFIILIIIYIYIGCRDEDSWLVSYLMYLGGRNRGTHTHTHTKVTPSSCSCCIFHCPRSKLYPNIKDCHTVQISPQTCQFSQHNAASCVWINKYNLNKILKRSHRSRSHDPQTLTGVVTVTRWFQYNHRVGGDSEHYIPVTTHLQWHPSCTSSLRLLVSGKTVLT